MMSYVVHINQDFSRSLNVDTAVYRLGNVA
jgi:hypothetical protein